MPKPPEPTRRQVLMVGAAAALLPGCDRLVLPSDELIDRISPITSNANFYVQSYGLVPNVEAEQWSLELFDRGTLIATIDQAYLDGLEAVDLEHTLQCIGSSPAWQAQGNAIWSGVPLTEIFDDLGVTVDASIVELKLDGYDDYDTSIPITDLDAPIWVVWRMNHFPLPPSHGFPVRLLVPGRYGTKNVKWIRSIELIDTPHTGYWERQNWSQAATYRLNGFIRSPGDLQNVAFGPLRIIGTAFAGSVAIQKVEVSTDEGATWQDAVVDYGPGPNIWTLWSFDFDPPEPGEYSIALRVTDEQGNVADMAEGSSPLDGYDGAQAITFRCA